MRIEQGRTTTIIADAASSTTLLCLTSLSFSQAVGTTTQPLIPYFCILYLPHDKTKNGIYNKIVLFALKLRLTKKKKHAAQRRAAASLFTRPRPSTGHGKTQPTPQTANVLILR